MYFALLLENICDDDDIFQCCQSLLLRRNLFQIIFEFTKYLEQKGFIHTKI